MDDLVRFLRACHQEMNFEAQGLGFRDEDVLSTLAATTANGGLLTLEFDDEGVSGAFAAAIVPNHTDYSQTRACEWIWHSRPGLSTRRRVEIMQSLLSKAIRWATKHHHYLMIGTSTQRPAAGRILERHGFEAIQTVYGRRF